VDVVASVLTGIMFEGPLPSREVQCRSPADPSHGTLATRLVIRNGVFIVGAWCVQAFGCQLVLTPAAKGMKGAIAKAQEIVASLGPQGFMLQQFDNPDNPKVHR
jgi:hypothetical protein